MIGILNFSFLASAIGFILGLKLMSAPKNAKSGNIVTAISMGIAILSTTIAYKIGIDNFQNLIILVLVLGIGTFIGRFLAYKYQMTEMPELVSLFNALGGLCAVIIAINEGIIVGLINSSSMNLTVLLLSIVLGAASFSGSIVAYLKLGGKFKLKLGNTKLWSNISVLLIIGLIVSFFVLTNFIGVATFLLLLSVIAMLYGVFFASAVGGADMPVLISLLNAVTGVVTAFSGLLFESPIMLLGGIFVGSTGVFLTVQMCNAMNRSLLKVLSGQSNTGNIPTKTGEQDVALVTPMPASQLASVLAYSENVAIIPGFGMAVAQAQKICFELQSKLQEQGTTVKYIIHPVAGRMPGHMNVLLAEANIDYDHIVDMNDVNDNMNQFDMALVIGANDVVNPAALTDPNSPIYGMPIIKAFEAKQVCVLKRGMSTGYSGIENPLFEKPNCKLLFGDAKESLQAVLNELKKI